MSEPWSHAFLAERVGEAFGARTDVGERRVELIEVQATPEQDGGNTANPTQPFTLLFRVPDGALPQGTYRLENPELAGKDVFLVPVGVDLNEAVFQ